MPTVTTADWRSALPLVSHPYADYSLQDAVRLADTHRQLILQPPPASLEEARDVVKLMMSTAYHVWITGMAALDVLDAAIDGRDLAESCRLI
ncbi:hypothetical protein [Pseudomonas sp.]|uniref:hypothetical protein n=1 Tax=Pseudomonas sp. TaxID=306 RepID=UPI00299CD79F|nr:hypothetical protein [Pseudomonas sp.]MDX1366879.1 hypothetical protein [Pseudomonas sp.]